MTFDLISILFVISINYLFVSIFLFWNWITNRQHFKGLLNWALAYTLVAIAFALQFLRAAIPELFSVILSNIILITSYIVTTQLYNNRIISKYAFSGKDSGLIQITLEKKNRDITLIIQDDGNGLPVNFIL